MIWGPRLFALLLGLGLVALDFALSVIEDHAPLPSLRVKARVLRCGILCTVVALILHMAWMLLQHRF